MIALALAVALAFAAVPGPAPEHPIFTTANVEVAGSWTGYRATIQVRPLAYAIWPGGYLTDGTFVQNGFLYYGDGLYAFAWATPNTCCGDQGQVPLVLTKVNPAPLSWVTFEMTWANGRWTFAYRDAKGYHRQGSWRSNARLGAFLVANEYWAAEPKPFGTQAVRRIQVRNGRGVWVTPPMSYGPPPETCGYESITSRARGNIVIRSAEGPCRPHTVLWR